MRRARTQAPPQPQNLVSEAPSASNTPPYGQGWAAGAALPKCCHATRHDGRWWHCLECKWRKLVAWPLDDVWLTRRHIAHWAWMFFHSERVLLRPALGPDGKSTRVAVVADTLKGTPFCFAKGVEPGNVNGDEVLTTLMRVHWWEDGRRQTEETHVHHALALRYVTEAALYGAFLASPLPDHIWDYTREHPDAPFVQQPGPPQLVASIINPVKERPRQSRAYDFDL